MECVILCLVFFLHTPPKLIMLRLYRWKHSPKYIIFVILKREREVFFFPFILFFFWNQSVSHHKLHRNRDFLYASFFFYAPDNITEIFPSFHVLKINKYMVFLMERYWNVLHVLMLSYFVPAKAKCRNKTKLCAVFFCGVPLQGKASCPLCALTPRRCFHPSGSGTDTAWICLAGGPLSVLHRKVKGQVTLEQNSHFTIIKTMKRLYIRMSCYCQCQKLFPPRKEEVGSLRNRLFWCLWNF